MKLLIIGDPHGKLPKNLSTIIKKNKIEVIICVGDIAPAPIIPKKGETFEQACKRVEKVFKKIIDKLCSYKLPFVTLRGNVYTNTKKNNQVTHKIFFPHKNLYTKKTGRLKIKGEIFILFDMIYEKHSFRNPKGFKQKDYLFNNIRGKKLNKMLNESEDPVILSHAPPYGYLDKIDSGKHVGSKILLRAIKKHQPRYVFCGHIHEAKGKVKIGKTIVYNVGCCGDYVVVDV